MNITLKHLRAFLAVVELKSFAQACEALHLSQPALSITIKNLESLVGGKLLTRTTRALSLTPEGKQFLPVAKRLMDDFDNAFIELEELFTLKRGNLNFAAMPSFASTHLSQHLSQFTNAYPDIKVTINDVVAESAVEMVKNGKVEFAISFDPGDLDGLNFDSLFTDKLVAALPQNNPLLVLMPDSKDGKESKYNEGTLTWQQLSQFPFIALKRPSSIRLLMDTTLAEHSLFLNVMVESNQLATVVQMVTDGLGVSAVPSLYKQQMDAMNIEYRALTSPSISRRVGVITRKRSDLSQSAQRFISLLSTHYLTELINEH
jgi:LysR family carnitine catabolism transcriptional activator